MKLQDFDLTKQILPPLPELPPEAESTTSLDELNIDHALYRHYLRVTQLAKDAINDTDIPANQRAQVMNTLTSLLQQIAKIRTDLYTSERLKIIEQTLLASLKNLPKETQDEFLEEYERAIQAAY